MASHSAPEIWKRCSRPPCSVEFPVVFFTAAPSPDHHQVNLKYPLPIQISAPPPDEDAKAEIEGEGTQADVPQVQTQDHPPPPPPPQQQQQPPSQQKESSILGDLFGFEDLMKPEEPDLVDQCSRSSFTSQSGRGKAVNQL